MKSNRLVCLTFLAGVLLSTMVRAVETSIALGGTDGAAEGATAADALRAGFQSPPPAARPELFWDWMHDMVTQEGITHDLEAMKRNGFGLLAGSGSSRRSPPPCSKLAVGKRE